LHFSITDYQFTDSGPRHADDLVRLVHLTGRFCSSPLPSLHPTATAVTDGEGADGEVRWYDHSRLNYAGASMNDIGLSDVPTTGSLPFITAMVLDQANKAIFQTTSGWQYVITCALCCCQDGQSPPAAAVQSTTLKTSEGLR